MACNVNTLIAQACASGIGKETNPITLLQMIAELLCEAAQGAASEPLVYRALMTQTGTNNPTVTVLENTIGNIVWVRDDVGTYLGSLTGAFPPSKTMAFIGENTTSPSLSFVINVSSADQLQVLSSAFNSGGPGFDQTDGLLVLAPIDIRVYP